MKKLFTKEEILKGSGCYKDTPCKSEGIIGNKKELSINEILDLEIPLKDKFWFVRNNCELNDNQFRKIAIGCASIVLPIYEKKYPENKAPREAIKAAQDYLNGNIDLQSLKEKRNAASHASHAAYNADADAADAATSAYDVHDFYATNDIYLATSTSAAYVTDAAYAYAYNTYAPDYKELLFNFLKMFVNDEN